jgi:hypothetical protein
MKMEESDTFFFFILEHNFSSTIIKWISLDSLGGLLPLVLLGFVCGLSVKVHVLETWYSVGHWRHVFRRGRESSVLRE